MEDEVDAWRPRGLVPWDQPGAGGFRRPVIWTVLQDPEGNEFCVGEPVEQGGGVNPETHYVKTPDGVYIAYQTVATGRSTSSGSSIGSATSTPIWEYRPSAEWFRGLASFSRLILHDRRGTGASSRNVDPPNLETRVADLRGSWTPSAPSDRPGRRAGGWRAERPVRGDVARARALALLVVPGATHDRAPDYPFGADADVMERSTQATIDLWGTDAYGYSEWRAIQPEAEPFPWGWLSRQTATPDVAAEMDRIYNETDVRGAMPAIAAPVLLLAREQRPRGARVPRRRSCDTPRSGSSRGGCVEDRGAARRARCDPGVRRRRAGGARARHRLVDGAVHRHRGSTQKQAAMGDHRYKGLIEQHHAIVRDGLRRWHGLEPDTAGDGFYATFDGPARAIRCASRSATASASSGSRSAPACTRASVS